MFSLIQFYLAIISHNTSHNNPSGTKDENELPFVTIQLPVYNERYVVDRLIRATAEIKYPKDKLEIQILDDSTDETSSIINDTIKELSLKGINIEVVQRSNREGYKAGALANGLARCKGDFIGIFDADFIPPLDFLLKTIPHFNDPNTGMVQVRWGHLNKNYSFLTKLQAFGLDAHFMVEQPGRNQSGAFINFNGTAGIWRKTAIIDSGGWSAETLTEDLDLSYRAQLKGWKFKYLEDTVAPAELPAEIMGLRSQQFRWNKGAAQNMLKNLPSVLRSDLPMMKKMHAFFHLNNSAIFVAIMIAFISSIPLLIWKSSISNGDTIFHWMAISLLAYVFLGSYFYIPYKLSNPDARFRLLKFIYWFPLFLCISMGLAFQNTMAVLEGWFGKNTAFIRTPKYNLTSSSKHTKLKNYQNAPHLRYTTGELFVVLYSIAGIAAGIHLKDTGLIPFHFMMAAGSLVVMGYTLIHSRNFK